MEDQAKNVLLEDLIRDMKKQVRNGFVAGIAGLALTCLGFFSYAYDVHSGAAWLAVGSVGVAVVIAAFYVMIRADKQSNRLKRQLATAPSPAAQPSEAPHSEEDQDKYFDEDYEKWKNPFEEQQEQKEALEH